MSSSTPTGPGEQEPDDTDTGPLQPITSADSPERVDHGGLSRDNPPPAQETWAGRFDAPLTVTPRQVQRRRSAKPLIAAGEPATTTAQEPSIDSQDVQRLQRMLPRGYPDGACAPIEPPEGLLAQVDCDANTDPGGPQSATYTLSGDKTSLEAAFNTLISAATRVNCPGNIQSPGPWRRNATPDRTSGQLFCGLRDGRPSVVWTDEARLMVSAVRAGPQGPTFPQLYAWWSSHS